MDKKMTGTAEQTLTGKTALVTGAVRRSGRAIALELAKYGASVAINTRQSADEANQVKAELEALGVKAGVFLCDVTDEHGVTDRDVSPDESTDEKLSSIFDSAKPKRTSYRVSAPLFS